MTVIRGLPTPETYNAANKRSYYRLYRSEKLECSAQSNDQHRQQAATLQASYMRQLNSSSDVHACVAVIVLRLSITTPTS